MNKKTTQLVVTMLTLAAMGEDEIYGESIFKPTNPKCPRCHHQLYGPVRRCPVCRAKVIGGAK
jgi:rubrerythrin